MKEQGRMHEKRGMREPKMRGLERTEALSSVSTTNGKVAKDVWIKKVDGRL